MSDQHARRITGCYGNQTIRTQHIDSIAQNGARFDAAYNDRYTLECFAKRCERKPPAKDDRCAHAGPTQLTVPGRWAGTHAA